ncbi:MAG: hypothetical protein KDC38_04580 [Planctomycetes bacterium]|nr:hypothetical protein [Planctomycetota bacterium]
MLERSGPAPWLIIALLFGLAPRAEAQCAPAPYGTGGYWVSSFASDEILVFDGFGNFQGSHAPSGLNGPRGITVTPAGEIYVASQLTDAILVLDSGGNLLRTIDHAFLDGPTGGSIGPDGDYYVCSFGNDLVLRFDASESLVATYTSPGLNGPNCIVFLPSGEFVVTGQLSNDVHRFDVDGTPLGSFATGQSSVMGAALDLDGRLLTAAGSSDDVKLFDCVGALLDVWDIAGGPQSIAVREDGTIFVTTFYTDEVIALDPSGAVLFTWVGGNTLRGIEFMPAPLPTFERGDANLDGAIDLSDAVATLSYLFTAGTMSCPDAADTNDDGAVDIADPVALLAFLFQAGAAPPSPFGAPGFDPTVDDLRCSDG